MTFSRNEASVLRRSAVVSCLSLRGACDVCDHAILSSMLVVSIGVFVAASPGDRRQSIERTEQATFGVRATLAPIDVRVLDREGRPVADLEQADFTIREDGVLQQIRHFERHSFQPGPSQPQTASRTDSRDESTARGRRAFLIVIDRLWLPRLPFGGVRALTRFVREHLLPQDYVAVLAFDRVTDLTTDHGHVAAVIERLQRYQEAIGFDTQDYLRLYAYGGQPMPASMQAALDSVFKGPSNCAFRTLPRAGILFTAEHLAQELRDILAPGRLSAYAASQSRQGARALERFNSCIQYLRFVDADRHLVLLTGWQFQSADDERRFAAIANDARVAVHLNTFRGMTQGAGPMWTGPGWSQFAAATRSFADLTGGQASPGEDPDQALIRLDRATRVGYVLGYYPSNSSWDGRYREVVVKVTRPPGAVVLFRHGYYAQQRKGPYDAMRLITQDRIQSAAASDEEIGDMKVTLKASLHDNSVAIRIVVDAARVHFTETAGVYAASLEVAVFCGDGRQNTTGQVRDKIALALDRAAHSRALNEGVRYDVSIPVKGATRYVRVVVYNYADDLTGTASVRLQ